MSLSLPTGPIADMFTQAEEARSRGEQIKRTQERFSPEIAESIAKGGVRNWWFKPSVMVDLAEAATTPDDWAYLGSMVGTVASGFKQYEEKVKARELAESLGQGGVTGAVSRIGKGLIRNTMTAIESPYQEVQGVLRATVAPASYPGGKLGIGGVKGEGFVGSQSSLGILLEKFIDGEIGVDDILLGSESAAGKGYLTGGDVRVEQAQRAYRSANIGGHALTLGRLAAYQVSEPGTRAHNIISGFIDAGAIVTMDPANLLLGGAGKAIKAGRYFDAEAPSLLLKGNKATITENVGRWLDSRPGGKFMERLVETTDPVKVLDLSKGELPIPAAVALADATDVASVRRILGETLGLETNRIPKGGIAFGPNWHFTETGLAVRHRIANERLFSNMPAAGRLDRTDPEAFVSQLRAQMLNARVPRDKVDELTNKAMRAAASGNPGNPLAADQFDAIVSVKAAVKESLVAAGVPTDRTRSLTRLWDGFEHMRTYNIDAMTSAERVLPDGVTIAGKDLPAPTPQALEQFLGRYVVMPDTQVYREIRTRTSAWAKAANKTAVGRRAIDAEVSASLAADALMKAWKPLQLLRGAYMLRVGGDEQARMGVAGLSSLFSRHPVSFISIAMADDGRIARLLDKVPGVSPGRMGVDLTGRKLDVLDEGDFAEALYKSTTELLGQQTKNTVKAPGYIPIRVGEQGYTEAWADGLKFLHDNPVARRLASGEPLAAVQDWFWQSGYRAGISGSGRAENVAPLAAQVSTRAGADRYVAETMQTWIDDVTQGDARLIDAVATGRVAGGKGIHSNFKITKAAKAFLDDLVEQGVRPEHVIGSPSFQIPKTAGQGYDAFINHAFDVIATRPANWASRSTSFKQYLWKRGEALLGEATPEAKAKLLDIARGEAKLSRSHIKRLEAIEANGTLDLDTINLLANQYAARETKRLLYDLANRGQIFDALRLVFPFGEAWKEVMTTWFHLVAENPRSIRTLQRTVEGARGAGWFQTDPQTGQEVFVLPGSPELTEALSGVKTDMVAPVSGLSIASSVVPGIGPAIQFAAGTFLPEKPQFDLLREVIFQFGGEGEGIVSMLTPAWMDKLQRATRSPESDRSFNADVGYVLNALSASGDYDLSNPDDLLRMQEDAVDKARRLNVLRGITQFWAPSPPRVRVFLENATTQALLTRTLADEFRKMQNEDYDTALDRFIGKYGVQALQAAVPLSKAEVYGLGASEQFGEFERANSRLFKKYKQVAGLFAPEDADDDFSATVYDRQFRQGLRTVSSQDDRVAERNHILARLIYNQQKKLIGDRPNQAQKDWLAEVKNDLINKYPGYTPEQFEPEKVPVAVRQMEKAAREESLDGNSVAEAARFYFDQRARAIEAAGKLSTLQRGKTAAHLRDWLRAIAESITAQTPEFARVWDSLLSRELAETEEKVAE